MSVTLKIHWEPMAINRVSPGVMETEVGDAEITATLENGDTIYFPEVEVPPTLVQQADPKIAEVWYVDQCNGGGFSEENDILDLTIDREECRFVIKDFRFEALPVKYTFTLTTFDGKVASGSCMSPPCIIDLVSNPIEAEPLDMTCVLEWETPPPPSPVAA